MDKLEDITEEAMDTMFDTNVKGLVYVTQAVVPGMRARNSGHVINIGSVAGQQAYANGSIYCATKAAVASITRALMAETVDTAIRVSEINPGTYLEIKKGALYVVFLASREAESDQMGPQRNRRVKWCLTLRGNTNPIYFYGQQVSSRPSSL